MGLIINSNEATLENLNEGIWNECTSASGNLGCLQGGGILFIGDYIERENNNSNLLRSFLLAASISCSAKSCTALYTLVFIIRNYP